MLGILIFASFPFFLLAQEPDQRSPSSIYMELLGNGAWYSINFDKITVLNSSLSLASRIGFGYVPGMEIRRFVAVPFELTTLAGAREHFFEIGPGITYLYLRSGSAIFSASNSIAANHNIRASMRLGYRYQQESGGLMLRAGFIIINQVDLEWDSYEPLSGFWPGISVGYTLKRKTSIPIFEIMWPGS